MYTYLFIRKGNKLNKPTAIQWAKNVIRLPQKGPLSLGDFRNGIASGPGYSSLLLQLSNFIIHLSVEIIVTCIMWG